MSIVPSVLIANMSASSNSYASLTKDLVELYADDLPSPRSLAHEVHLWHTDGITAQIKFLPRHQKLYYMCYNLIINYLSVTRTCAQQVLHHRCII